MTGRVKEINRDDLPYAETEGDWNDYLDGITAEAWGLTIEELRHARTLEGEELNQYMEEHMHKG